MRDKAPNCGLALQALWLLAVEAVLFAELVARRVLIGRLGAHDNVIMRNLLLDLLLFLLKPSVLHPRSL